MMGDIQKVGRYAEKQRICRRMGDMKKDGQYRET